jgi:HAE1 family hydrophobic/amphiphilic exporter-1
MEKPVGVNYIWGGDQENQSEGFGTLGFLLLAIILVYLVMVGLYDSFAHHLWLFAIPLSFIGALLALATNNFKYIYYSWSYYVNWSGL